MDEVSHPARRPPRAICRAPRAPSPPTAHNSPDVHHVTQESVDKADVEVVVTAGATVMGDEAWRASVAARPSGALGSFSELVSSRPEDELVQLLAARQAKATDDARTRAAVHNEMAARMDTGVRVNAALARAHGVGADERGGTPAASASAEVEEIAESEQSATNEVRQPSARHACPYPSHPSLSQTLPCAHSRTHRTRRTHRSHRSHYRSHRPPRLWSTGDGCRTWQRRRWWCRITPLAVLPRARERGSRRPSRVAWPVPRRDSR